MKKLAAAVLCTMLSTLAHSAPVALENKEFDLTGKFKVRASGQCNGHKVNAGGTSPTTINLSVKFDNTAEDGDTIQWYGDDLLPSGNIETVDIDDRINNKFKLSFADGATASGSALFNMAGIPTTATSGGTVTFTGYALTATAAMAKPKGSKVKLANLKIVEQVTAKLNSQVAGFKCKYSWTISREYTGFETVQ